MLLYVLYNGKKPIVTDTRTSHNGDRPRYDMGKGRQVQNTIVMNRAVTRAVQPVKPLRAQCALGEHPAASNNWVLLKDDNCH